MIVCIVIFDDSWEMHSEDKLSAVRDDFVKRLQGNIEDDVKTPLQSLIDYTVQGLKSHDAERGDGGQEVLDRLVDFCNHSPPQITFDSLGDYFEYRRIDAGVPYILACVKSSLCSSVWIESPKLAKILRFISDHVSLVNDLASYDKEERAFQQGKVYYLINAVHIVQSLFSLPTSSSAKKLTYAMQLDIEIRMKEEMDHLTASGELSSEMSAFLDAAMVMVAGNVFYSVVSSRYGGEKARIVV